MMRSSLGFIILLLTILNVEAQVPQWLNKLPKSDNPTYYYRTEYGTGNNEEIARNDAFLRMLQNVANSLGVAYDSKVANEAVLNGTSMEVFSMQNNIPVNKICEYVQYNNGSYRVYILCQVARKGNIIPVFEEYRDCDKIGNNNDALWRSIVIPGWGQLYKKKILKGIAIFAAEASLVTSSIYAEMNRSDNYRKSMETTNINIVKEYRKRADNWELNRNVMLGAAIGVYAINIIDAALAKGQIKYAWIPQNIGLTGNVDNQLSYIGVSITF